MESNRSRAATVPLIAGRPVLDLVNTVSWRGNPASSQDHLQSGADSLTWAVRAGVLIGAEATELTSQIQQHPAAARDLTVQLRKLRAVVTDALVPPATKPIALVEPLIREALTHSHLVRQQGAHGEEYYWWQVSELDHYTPTRRLTLDLLDLLMSSRGRIGVCADADCQWAFLDTSHAQNRQWCSSSDCGNRHRVRRHHQQQQRTRKSNRPKQCLR